MHLTRSAALAILTIGCASDLDPVASTSAPLVVTDRCEIRGLGALEGGELLIGRVRGGDDTASGFWKHLSPRPPTIVCAEPEWILCRLNGAELGDFGGQATVDGQAGFEYRVQIQDRVTPQPPEYEAGAVEVRTLTAARSYRPPRPPTDGTLEIVDAARVTIPDQLKITEGSANARHTATITFERIGHVFAQTCTYRGAGDRYVFDRCGDLAPGDTVDVRSLVLRVHSGSTAYPRTAVSVDLEVAPLTPLPRDRDFYRILVWNDAGEQVFLREGDVVYGDVDVQQLAE